MRQLLAAAALVAALSFVDPAGAQMGPPGGGVMCGPHDRVIASLENRHKEQRVAWGISQRGGLIEVFVSPAGTWTILNTQPGSPTCLADAGQDWQSHAPKPTKGPKL